MVKGTTSNGFEYSIDERVRGDRSTLRLLVKAIKGEPAEQLDVSFCLAERLLGDEQSEKLEEHIKAMNDGFCPNEVFDATVMEIFKGDHDLKNC